MSAIELLPCRIFRASYPLLNRSRHRIVVHRGLCSVSLTFDHRSRAHSAFEGMEFKAYPSGKIVSNQMQTLESITNMMPLTLTDLRRRYRRLDVVRLVWSGFRSAEIGRSGTRSLGQERSKKKQEGSATCT